MMKLDNFVGMMTGHFDNKDQFKKMQAEGKTYPYAEHYHCHWYFGPEGGDRHHASDRSEKFLY